MTIEILVNETIYRDRIEVMKLSYKTKSAFSPKQANAVIYRMLGDTYNIRKGHDQYKKQFSIKNLTPDGFEAVFMTSLPEKTMKERALKHGLAVTKIEYNSDIPVPNLSTIDKITLNFNAPTNFLFNGNKVPAFDSYVFWNSILSTWYNIKQREPLLNAAQLISLIYPTKMDIEQRLVFLDKDITFYGFTGKVELVFDKNAIGDIKLFIYFLLETASYIGVGTKTGWGMGSVNIKEIGCNFI